MSKQKKQEAPRRARRRWAAAAWLGLLLMLFNVVNATAMGTRQMAAMVEGGTAICDMAEHHAGAGGHHHGGTGGQHSPDCCSCCVSMCCTGAAVPDAGEMTPAPSLAWTSLYFVTPSAPQPSPAPLAGGGARAPPAVA